ncbi:helix-turn-helix domain-containing protein [Shewanella eurypsychrophilus]|uniref:Helix-turn-helix domain-containing protein n=1 Tax=Shewanella eurypsychrophilus TaxID=2593656 RepID=A0ABX6VA52_9GAMM|nr:MULTISPECIES: helix-turn-helix domain-containing protein [Shewanella]QFU24196.1 helix-turn-helix domain-containing protein [Shewanella sp. YLB-09]QPG59401.1 helix-turn-helix domain-containing protein [Shewanella eurypsychrophilus]
MSELKVRGCFTTTQKEKIRAMVADGYTRQSIANKFGVHVSTIYRVVKA